MYNLIKYRNNYSKTSGSLLQYCKDILAVCNHGDVVELNETNSTDSFNFKTYITGQNGDNGTKKVETMVSLKYLHKFTELLKFL